MSKNPDLSVLRVAVVPTKTGNGISQDSTYEKIVACEETQYFSVPDYFKAQNDKELPLMHWSFLLDSEKKVNITGCNTDEIDYNDRAIKIGRIKDILATWGNTSCCELELDHSPCMKSAGTNKNNVSELIENFYATGVESVVYQNETEIANNEYDYEDLSDEMIDEIAIIMDEYEANMLKTEKRCAD